MFRWYTSYNEFIGALAIFLTATVAVVLEQKEEGLGPGKVGLALFSVFQVRFVYFTNFAVTNFMPVCGGKSVIFEYVLGLRFQSIFRFYVLLYEVKIGLFWKDAVRFASLMNT